MMAVRGSGVGVLFVYLLVQRFLNFEDLQTISVLDVL
jgi:hypothetical protein